MVIAAEAQQICAKTDDVQGYAYYSLLLVNFLLECDTHDGGNLTLCRSIAYAFDNIAELDAYDARKASCASQEAQPQATHVRRSSSLAGLPATSQNTHTLSASAASSAALMAPSVPEVVVGDDLERTDVLVDSSLATAGNKRLTSQVSEADQEVSSSLEGGVGIDVDIDDEEAIEELSEGLGLRMARSVVAELGGVAALVESLGTETERWVVRQHLHLSEGLLHLYLGEYVQALHCFFNALEFGEFLSDQVHQECLNGLICAYDALLIQVDLAIFRQRVEHERQTTFGDDDAMVSTIEGPSLRASRAVLDEGQEPDFSADELVSTLTQCMNNSLQDTVQSFVGDGTTGSDAAVVIREERLMDDDVETSMDDDLHDKSTDAEEDMEVDLVGLSAVISGARQFLRELTGGSCYVMEDERAANGAGDRNRRWRSASRGSIASLSSMGSRGRIAPMLRQGSEAYWHNGRLVQSGPSAALLSSPQPQLDTSRIPQHPGNRGSILRVKRDGRDAGRLVRMQVARCPLEATPPKDKNASRHVLFVIDASLGMQKATLRVLCAEVARLVRTVLRGHDVISLVACRGIPQVVLEGERVSSGEVVLDALSNLARRSPQGRCNVWAGVARGISLLQWSPVRSKYALVLGNTDTGTAQMIRAAIQVLETSFIPSTASSIAHEQSNREAVAVSRWLAMLDAGVDAYMSAGPNHASSAALDEVSGDTSPTAHARSCFVGSSGTPRSDMTRVVSAADLPVLIHDLGIRFFGVAFGASSFMQLHAFLRAVLIERRLRNLGTCFVDPSHISMAVRVDTSLRHQLSSFVLKNGRCERESTALGLALPGDVRRTLKIAHARHEHELQRKKSHSRASLRANRNLPRRGDELAELGGGGGHGPSGGAHGVDDSEDRIPGGALSIASFLTQASDSRAGSTMTAVHHAHDEDILQLIDELRESQLGVRAVLPLDEYTGEGGGRTTAAGRSDSPYGRRPGGGDWPVASGRLRGCIREALSVFVMVFRADICDEG